MLDERKDTPATLPGDTDDLFSTLDPSGDLYIVITDPDFLDDVLSYTVPISGRETPQLLARGDHYLLLADHLTATLSNAPPMEMQLASLLAMDGVHGRTTSLPASTSSMLLDASNVVVPLAVEASAHLGALHAHSIEDLRDATQQQFTAGHPIDTSYLPLQDLAAKAERLLFTGFRDTLLLALDIWQQRGVEDTAFSHTELLVLAAAFVDGIEYPELNEFAAETNWAGDGTLMAARQRLQDLDLVTVRRVQRGVGRPRYRLRPGPQLAPLNSLYEAVHRLDEAVQTAKPRPS
jgi:hypothetical protein